MPVIELTYRLEPRDLVVYRQLAWQHATRRRDDAGAGWLGFFGFTFAAAALLAAADQLFPLVTGRPFGYAEFLSGFAVGYLLYYALFLRSYRSYVRLSARSGGPTLSEHRLSLTADGLRSKSPVAEGVYRWPCFTEMTVNTGLLVLWMERGSGLIIPRSAFADVAAEAEFVEVARRFMAEAGGHTGAARPGKMWKQPF